MTARWMAISLMTVISLSVSGLSQSQDRFELTAQQVARTISERGIEITGQQVSLLARVVATDPKPVLDILSIGPLGDQRPTSHSGTHSLVKLTCHVVGACLPFYAIVSWPKTTVEGVTSASGATPGAVYAMLRPNAAITMRAGTHATLVMDDERSQIQVAVISLENGAAGQSIRVASPDRKQFYIGEVVSANLLKRSF